MTVELVHGFAGTPHIEANDVASFNTGVIGPEDYVLNTKGRLNASMSDANTFVLDSGDLIMQGRHVTFTSPTTAIVGSGSQGMKRNDLAVCRYTRASNGIETAELVIIRGTPTQGTPADPDHEQGRIIEGATIADMPLYRIPITGIVPGAPIPVHQRIPSMWDCITHLRTGKKTLYFDAAESARLFDDAEFTALAGRPYDPNRDYVGVMLTNRSASSNTSAIACEYVPDVKWLTVRMNKTIARGAEIDITYIIVLGQ